MIETFVLVLVLILLAGLAVHLMMSPLDRSGTRCFAVPPPAYKGTVVGHCHLSVGHTGSHQDLFGTEWPQEH